jgi:hypothetical protein
MQPRFIDRQTPEEVAMTRRIRADLGLIQAEAKDRKRPGAALMLAGLFTALGSLLIPAWQTVTWLRYGLWPGLSFGMTWRALGWSFPRTDWVDMQRGLLWVFDLPTTLIVFILGMVIFAYGLRIAATRF